MTSCYLSTIKALAKLITSSLDTKLCKSAGFALVLLHSCFQLAYAQSAEESPPTLSPIKDSTTLDDTQSVRGSYQPQTVIATLDYNTVMASYTNSDVTHEVVPLDTGMMGDIYDINSGQLSFSQVDVSIPGNFSLPVAFGRRSNANPNEQPEFAFGPLGNWEVDLPYIVTRVSQNTMGITNRCSSSYYGGGKFSIGYKLNIPGTGEKTLMHYEAGVPQTSSLSPQPLKATKNHWVVQCNLAMSGASGEGFRVISPSGDIYLFNKVIRRHAGEFYDASSFNEVNLDSLYFVPSQVTDVHGNWVKYEYNQYGITKIHSSDNRVITVQYTGDKITKVVANGREWRYSYTPTGNSLSQVTLPDQTTWEYATGALRIDADHFCESRRVNSGFIRSVYVKHPNGTEGRFKLKDTSHYVKNPITANAGYTTLVSVGRPDNAETQCTYGYPFQWNYFTRSLIEKRLVQPDGTESKWTYDYHEAPGIWRRKNLSPYPNSILLSKWVWDPNIDDSDKEDNAKRTVIDPEGGKTVTYISRIQNSGTENTVTKIEKYDSASSTTPLEVQYFDEYAFKDNSGVMMQYNWVPLPSRLTQFPVKVRIQRGSDIYTTQTSYNLDMKLSDYSFQLPTQIVLSSNLSNSHMASTTRTIDFGFHHIKSKWILSLDKFMKLDGVTVDENSYNALGQLTETKKFNRSIATYGYYSSAYPTYKGSIEWVQDALNNRTYLKDWKRGKPQTVTMPDGTYMSRKIDDNGWITSITDFNNYCTNYDYDDIGRLTYIDPCDSQWADTVIDYDITNSNEGHDATYAGMLKQTITTDNRQTVKYYDGFHRPVLIENSDLNAPDNTSYTQTNYDKLGRVTYQSLPYHTSQTPYGVSTAYDGLGRVITVDDNTVSGSTSYQYLSNNRIQVNDNKGNVTTTTYFSFGSPSNDLATHIDSPESTTTLLKYNKFGYPTSITQGGLTEYRVYDSYQQLCKTVRADVGNTAFSYNLNGQIQWQASGSSVDSSSSSCDYSVSTSDKISFEYDNKGNLIRELYNDVSPDKTYIYDDGNRLTSIVTSQTETTYEYNSLNLIERETLEVDGNTFILDYGFDSLANLSSIKYPSGRTVYLNPNAMGQATSVGSYATNAQYFPNGMVKSHQYGNGFVHSATQYSSGLPNGFFDQKGSAYALNHGFTYDANRNITFIDDKVNSAYDLSLTYDRLDRLNNITDSYLGSGDVNYDGMGNITYYKIGVQTINYYYDSQKRLTHTTGSKAYSFSYDTKGNVTHNGSRSFTYNAANQMIQSGSYTYVYDGNNKRVQEEDSSGVSYSMYGSNGKLMYRREDNQDVEYYYLGSKLVAKQKGNAITYIHTDYLGSPAAESNTSGSVLSRTHYQPFGQSIETPKDDVGYTGHKYDKDLGLNYMQARYYDPFIGRFYSNDPVGFKSDNIQSFGRYIYGNNNPYRYIDPDGMEAQSFFIEGKSYENLGQAVAGAWGDLRDSLTNDVQSGLQEFNQVVGENAGTVSTVLGAYPHPAAQIGSAIASVTSDLHKNSAAATSGAAASALTGVMVKDIATDAGRKVISAKADAAIHVVSVVVGAATAAATEHTERNNSKVKNEEAKE